MIEAIIKHFEDHESTADKQMLFTALDHAVMEAVLNRLEKIHHQEFLQLAIHQHHDPSLIDWLEERSEGITPHLQTILIEVKTKILTELKNKND